VVEVETWFMESGKIGAQREWRLREKRTGRTLGRATSTWVMINMHTRRLAKLPEVIRQRCSWYQLHPPEHSIPTEQTRSKLPDFPSEPALASPRQVARSSDVDMNGHINNVTYIAWTLETVPKHIADDCHLYQVRVRVWGCEGGGEGGFAHVGQPRMFSVCSNEPPALCVAPFEPLLLFLGLISPLHTPAPASHVLDPRWRLTTRPSATRAR
jgi:acyl-CoA thioesterase FadM